MRCEVCVCVCVCVYVCLCVCVCDGGLDQELFRRSGMCKGVFLRLMFCLAHR